MTAILVLGMHRSGTSCLAALLAAAGARVPGEAIRNWDNPRGHHEATALVRLNDDVLAHSGGHWLEPPASLRWTSAQAAERDRLLALMPGGGPALLKDPRSLLTLAFWRASPLPHRCLGVVRHPLAVARSLLAWRGMPIDDGLRLWLAHNRVLAEAAVPVADFDRPSAEFIAAVAGQAGAAGLAGDPARLAPAYANELVHHDAGAGPAGDPALLAECTALHHRLVGVAPVLATSAPAFPWAAVAAFQAALAAGDAAQALFLARQALASGSDPAAVVAPLATACLRARRASLLLTILDGAVLPPALVGLLRGKACLALGDPAAARHLAAACAVAEPLYEARHLLPDALRAAGEAEAADAALADLLPVALYPHRVWARRAEWAWARGDADAAFTHLAAALEAAPPWRRGRLLTRRAVWRTARGDAAGAAADHALARIEDPAWAGDRVQTWPGDPVGADIDRAQARVKAPARAAQGARPGP